jgi:hypothetical protein
MADPHLGALVVGASRRLQHELAAQTPFMAQHIGSWMHELAGSDQPADYFLHPVAFPMLSLPWWAESSLHRPHGTRPDLDFQADLIYSTMNGYYHIRMVDNVMDGDATVEPLLLPALGFFHLRFHGAYQRYFAYPHPFWELFEQIWAASAEATVHDRQLQALTLEPFETITAKKLCAAAIPVAAVCLRYGRPDLVEPWSALIDRLGRWHQLWNDLFTWRRDAANGVATYFLSECDRRRRPAEPVGAWIVREGFAWGIAVLEEWMAELRAMAAPLGSPALDAYLEHRIGMVRQQFAAASAGLRSAALLLALAPENHTGGPVDPGRPLAQGTAHER